MKGWDLQTRLGFANVSDSGETMVDGRRSLANTPLAGPSWTAFRPTHR